jgi:hypothetical protein
VFPAGPTVRAADHLSGASHGSMRCSLSSDEASDKRQLQEPLILEVKLVSALGA